MKSLILDFLHRWRWLFVISLIVSVASSLFGLPLILAPAAVVALQPDARRGVFRAVRPLPLTRLDQAKAWWVVGVPLLPLLSVPALVLGILLFPHFQPSAGPVPFARVAAPMTETMLPMEPRPAVLPETSVPVTEPRYLAPPQAPEKNPRAPWFAAAVQSWVALGYAGFCFFLMQWAPQRQAENLTENVQQGVFGLLWGISMPGVVFLMPNLPRSPDTMATWHWAVLAAAPVFVALSYFSAAELMRQQMVVTAAKKRPQATTESLALSGGLTGIPLYVVNFAGRIVLMVALIACVQMVVLRWMAQGNAPGHHPAVGMQVSLMGMMIGATIAESVGMRALRALPLSTVKLALLLSLVPWAGAFSGAFFSAVFCRAGDPSLSVWVNLTAQSFALCGWAILALSITLHISSGGRLFVLMLLSIIPGMAIQFAVKYTLLMGGIGLVAGSVGFALLIRGLRKSSAFYRPRGFFGMTPGQPTAVR
jgi:hypothetical protein